MYLYTDVYVYRLSKQSFSTFQIFYHCYLLLFILFVFYALWQSINYVPFTGHYSHLSLVIFVFAKYLNIGHRYLDLVLFYLIRDTWFLESPFRHTFEVNQTYLILFMFLLMLHFIKIIASYHINQIVLRTCNLQCTK